MRTPKEEAFLKDVSGHEMLVIRDDGVNRHIRFRRKETNPYWFDLITWSGTLCVDGDMGTYVFRRLEDMFEFFRTDREYAQRKGIALFINPSYWSEKLCAPESRDAQEFSADKFREHVKDAFDEWAEEEEPSDALKDELWQELEFGVLSSADDGEVRAHDAAREFTSDTAPRFSMEDCWEWNCREYKFHFIWCCYAIAWGIQKYDEAKA